ncbi:MAG TPA: DUF2339 domain-containing protein, partial [Candidatus Hydrogenedentes bacterium]|nr:DUF2339 domain-containing protein [Candidatus Hydrogenedentota bacterium]
MLAAPCLMMVLGFIALVAHRRRSQTVAGVSLFLAYYAVVLSCMHGGNAENIAYALGTCALLAVVALLFHTAHRWFVFTWVAMIATHVLYLYFFFAKPVGLAMTDKEYFWISNGFLALCWVVFSLACIVDARKRDEYRRLVAPMSGVNSAVFFCLAWIAIRHNYIESEWMFRLGIAGALLLFSILADLTGPRLNYLFQVFIAKTVIMFTLALQAYFSGEKLMVAMALQCLGLAFSYKRARLPVFKVLGLGLLLATYIGCIYNVKSAEVFAIAGLSLQANWFCCLGVALVFAVAAWFYEHFVERLAPEQREVSGQWVMADSPVDLPSATVAMLHAGAAAIILLTVTIVDQAHHPALPYILGGEAVGMAALGFLLRTPQVEVASVLVVVAAHVTYYAFLLFGPIGTANPAVFEAQPNYTEYTVLVVLFTFVGGYFWERYLRRLRGGHPWEHHFVAAIPYLAATFMLTTLLGRVLPSLRAIVGQDGLGVLLLGIGALAGFRGVMSAGVLAIGVGTVSFYRGLYRLSEPAQYAPEFMTYVLIAAMAFAAALAWERYLRRRGAAPPWPRDVLGGAPYLVATLMLVGVYARACSGVNAPVAYSLFGAALLAGASLARCPGMHASGIMALAVGGAVYLQGLYTVPQPMSWHEQFPIVSAIVLSACVAGERFMKTGERLPSASRRVDATFRWLIVAVTALLAILGLSAWHRGAHLTLYWLGAGLIFLVLGALFRESRYRWAGIGLFGAAIGRAFGIDLRQFDVLYQFFSFAGLALVLLVISWAYAGRRRRQLDARDAAAETRPKIPNSE